MRPPLRDGSGDLWWEVQPDQWVCANTQAQAIRRYFTDAESRTQQQIEHDYGPTWPQRAT